MTERSGGSAVEVSIGRQPIFDAHHKLWGYELFCVGSGDGVPAGFPPDSSVAVHVASSAYVCLRQIAGAGKHILVDFTERSVLENLPYVLPPNLATVKVREDAGARPEVVAGLARLKSDGYRVAIEGFSGAPECSPLYGLADIVTLDANPGNRDGIAAGMAAAQIYPVAMLAMHVRDRAQFKSCAESGFTLFHGPFFKSSERITVRKLSSNEMLRFMLLQAIEDPDLNLEDLAGTVQRDATVSLRLLAYLNSAAFAFTQKVRSVSHAITLLGWHNVRKWLRVVLLTDMSQGKDARELVLLSAQRGMFLELIGRDHDYWDFDPESLHLLGLFSLADALLGVPMAEIVANLPLDNKMKAALCGEPGNEYLPLLQLARLLEETAWEEIDSLVLELNLDARKVRAAFQSAINWAGELDAVPA